MKKIGDILNKGNKFGENDDNEFVIAEDISKMIDESIDKQEIFDKFLTYRRRMARLAAVQALYLYDFRKKKKK